jgi:hypothetical protein
MERSRRQVNDDDRDSRRGRDDDRGSRDRGDDRGRGRDRDDDRGSRRGRDDDRSGRSSGRRFEYQQRSAEDTKRRADKGGKDFDRILKDHIKMWKPADGDNRIRILPPTWDKADHFGFDVYLHYGVGPDQQTYLDLHKMKDQADPITEEYDIARRAEEDEEYVKKLESKKRVLVYIIDRDNEKEGVQAWSMPWTFDRDLVKVSVDRSNGEVLPIDHPEDGYDIEFEKKGKGARTEYLGVSVARRSTPLGKAEWLDFAMDNPLPDQLQYFDYDHIAKAFGGGGSSRSGRDDDRGDTSRSSRDRDDRDDSRDRGGRDRGGRDDDRGGRGNSRDEPELTWDSIHEMTAQELEDVIEQEKLDIDHKDAKDDLDLADWICEDLKLSKPAPKAEGRRRVVEDDSASDRLSKMRQGRRD